jgi:exosortase/archaeosortase family protein
MSRGVRGVVRRRLTIVSELGIAVAICLAGYYGAAEWFKVHEAIWTVAALHLVGVDSVSDVLPGHILMFRSNGELLNGVITTSCSSILTVVGLTALTAVVLRQRRLHALWGLLVALLAVVVANDLRLIASTLAGVCWGKPAMVLFHDWVGTVWTLAATLGGFLLMVCLTLPAAERAEQDVAGRHIARRPTSWARPGLGYRVPEPEARSTGRRRPALTGFIYRYVLPRAVSRHLAARREAGRIDYRIGHLPAEERATHVRDLVADGLGAHTASLLAVATYEQDPDVLDTLAEAIAARQWEPVTNDRIAAVRLWARGWLLSRRQQVAQEAAPAPTPAAARADDTGTIRAARPPVPVPQPRPAAARPRRTAAPRTDSPRSFARPSRGGRPDPTEDAR